MSLWDESRDRTRKVLLQVGLDNETSAVCLAVLGSGAKSNDEY
jgi:hypothetical protein